MNRTLAQLQRMSYGSGASAGKIARRAVSPKADETVLRIRNAASKDEAAALLAGMPPDEARAWSGVSYPPAD